MADGDIMIYLNGRSKPAYKCDCGANVFHKFDRDHPDRYKCNGCGARFTGEARARPAMSSES